MTRRRRLSQTSCFLAKPKTGRVHRLSLRAVAIDLLAERS